MLIPWVGPWRVEEVIRAKDVRMRHIDTGVEITVHTSTITRSPEEESPGDYDCRYEMVGHLQDVPGRIPRDHRLHIGDFAIVRADGRFNVGQVQEVFSDGQVHLLWWNTLDGKSRGDDKWYKVYMDKQKENGEAYAMKGDAQKRMWTLLPKADIVCTFDWPKMTQSQVRPLKLPMAVRKYFKTTN